MHVCMVHVVLTAVHKLLVCVYSLCLQEIEEAKADLGARGVDVS